MTRMAPVPATVALHVPFRLVKRGGRKEMQLLPGWSSERPRLDNTMIKAVVRAFRWQRMLEVGEHANIADLAKHEGIAASYLTRLMRLTHLAPDIVEMILDGRQPSELSLESLRHKFPSDWNDQRQSLRI